MNTRIPLGARLLRSYLDRTGVKRQAFATEVGCTTAAMRYWVKGERTPTIALALNIANATGGEVPIESWALEVPA